MTFGGQERRLRRRAGNDGVDRVSGSVDQHRSRAEQFGKALPEILGRQFERVENAAHRIVGHGCRLVHGQSAAVVLDDQIGECTTGVAGEPHRTLLAGKAKICLVPISLTILPARLEGVDDTGLRWSGKAVAYSRN